MKKSKFVDPLYVIFEKHLFDFPNEDLDLFIATIVNEYFDYLQQNEVIIPEKRMQILMRDLSEEVYDMYIKRIHGCLNLKDFRNSGTVTKLEKILAQDRYFKLTG